MTDRDVRIHGLLGQLQAIQQKFADEQKEAGNAGALEEWTSMLCLSLVASAKSMNLPKLRFLSFVQAMWKVLQVDKS